MEETDHLIRLKNAKDPTEPQYLPVPILPKTLSQPVEDTEVAQSSSESLAPPSAFRHFRMEHRSFVVAVFHIGIYTATPKLIQDMISPYMKEKYPEINDLERVKSKLQNYRKKKGICNR